MELIKIPEARVGNLLGPNGEAKAKIEGLTATIITVNADGDVTIEGESASEFFAKDVVKAIGRGFEPQDAEKLLSDRFMLEIMDLKEICRSENEISRVKGRVIGEDGKMKLEIEAATDSKISVYGWTVSIISPMDSMVYAQKAINRIIDGAQLTTVFNDLARYKREIFANRLMGK